MMKRTIFYWFQKAYSFSTAVPAVPVIPAELKPPSTRVKGSKRFIDKVRIHVRGGSGGQGTPSTGGLGAAGGHVFVKCKKGASLATYCLKQNKRIVAEHGSHHNKRQLKQKISKNTSIVVPPGTLVKDSMDQTICELNVDNEIVKLAKGGKGGSPHNGFKGERGERKVIVMELKIIADVGLTGFPNAGKSSLLNVLSRARPKVGHYPFTTINPTVGMIFFSDDSKISVADLPGLLEDAHLNKGMGHKFLRHIEQTKVIALVVDINGFQFNADSKYRSPIETTIILMKELALYQGVLLERPFVLVLNKSDTPNFQQLSENFINELKSIDKDYPLLKDFSFSEDILLCLETLLEDNCRNILTTSATEELGISELKQTLYDTLNLKNDSSLID